MTLDTQNRQKHVSLFTNGTACRPSQGSTELSSHGITATCYWLGNVQTGRTSWSLATACSLTTCLYLYMIISTCKGPVCLICWINHVAKEHLGVTFSTEMGLAWVYLLMKLVVWSKLDSCLISVKTACSVSITHTGMPD